MHEQLAVKSNSLNLVLNLSKLAQLFQTLAFNSIDAYIRQNLVTLLAKCELLALSHRFRNLSFLQNLETTPNFLFSQTKFDFLE